MIMKQMKIIIIIMILMKSNDINMKIIIILMIN